LKRIAEDFLPRELIHRQKRGFPVPIVQWLAEPAIRSRIEDILLDPRSMARGIVKRSVLESYLREVPVEQRRAPRGATELIWNLLNLELWQRASSTRSRLLKKGQMLGASERTRRRSGATPHK
jgi:asparagine synthase (glutamine-hydrolysing)